MLAFFSACVILGLVRIGKLNWPTLAIVAFILLLAINFYSTNRNNSRRNLPSGAGAPKVSIAATHGLIIAADGSLWSWGSDFFGWPVLGIPGTTNQTVLRRIGHENYWAGVSASASHNLAVTEFGTLWGWGENIHHQLNDSTEPSVDRPTPCVPGNDWRQAAAGGSFSTALKKDGTLWSWGDNWAGQLGIGSTNDAAAPVQIGSATNWTKIWAGMLNGIGLQRDGTLWFWGDNPALPTQLARSTNNFLSPTLISPDTNWMDAAFVSQAFLALKSDGTLWIWGRYARKYTHMPDLEVVPTRLGTNNDWQSISSSEWARDLYVVLRKKDGSVWTMQSPLDSRSALRLTQIALPKEIITVAAGGGGEHGVDTMHDGVCTGLALTRDGEAWVWGRNLGYTRGFSALQGAARIAQKIRIDAHWGDPQPITRINPEPLNVTEQKN